METYLLIKDEHDCFRMIRESAIVGIKPFHDEDAHPLFEITQTHFSWSQTGPITGSVIAKELHGMGRFNSLASYLGWFECGEIDWARKMRGHFVKLVDEMEAKEKEDKKD